MKTNKEARKHYHTLAQSHPERSLAFSKPSIGKTTSRLHHACYKLHQVQLQFIKVICPIIILDDRVENLTHVTKMAVHDIQTKCVKQQVASCTPRITFRTDRYFFFSF